MQPTEHLFVIIPGIGGSVLERRKGADRAVLWRGLGQLPSAILRPGRLALPDDDDVVATGLLDDWRFVGWTAVDGYRQLVERVAAFAGTSNIDWGDPDEAKLDARVVCFPFDFRKSVADAARRLDATVAERLGLFGVDEAPDDPSRRRVVVVAHSMGGLVARYWAGPLGGHAHCHSIVTLGTPHRGAPKALDVLANGWRIGRVPIPGPLTDVMRTWPGLHELLPRFRTIRDQDDRWVYPKDVELRGIDGRLAGGGFEMHEDIKSAWSALGERSPAVIPVMGVASDTLESAELSGSRVRSSAVLPRWISENDDSLATFLGDGTVPRISGIPIELDEARFRGLQRLAPGVKHGSLMDWIGLEGELGLLLTGVSTREVEGQGDRRIVVDLPEVGLAGERIEGTIRVYDEITAGGLEPCAEVTAVQYRLDEHNGWNNAMEGASGGWRFEIPDPAVGTLPLEARAVTASGNDPANITAETTVMDPACLEEVAT